MPANTSPIFALTPIASVNALLTTANTALDGTGTVLTIATGGTNGTRIDQVKVRNTGTSVATVIRLFLNNGSSNATAANNTLFFEATIAANTISQVAASTDYSLLLNISLPATYKINATIGTTVAAGLAVSAIGGDY
jgi:hypothetical protein